MNAEGQNVKRKDSGQVKVPDSNEAIFSHTCIQTALKFPLGSAFLDKANNMGNILLEL